MTEDDDSLEVPHRSTWGTYRGDELKPYAGRPGAMDAFDLPSRMGNKLHYRSGEVKEIE